MKLLLDTQVALWWLTDSPRLSKATRDVMANSPCAVSVASIWEVKLKHGLGKLAVAPEEFRDEMHAAGARILAVTDDHVLTPTDLPASHRDPFDRLLVGVAVAEHLSLLTADVPLIVLARKDARLPIRAA